MYLHLGQDTIVKKEEIVGIYDMDTSTISKWSRDYLSKAEKEKRVVNVSFELPKSYVVCKGKGDNKERVYICPLSSQTLLKRMVNDSLFSE